MQYNNGILRWRAISRITIVLAAISAGAILVAMAFGLITSRPAYAAPLAVGNEPWLEINCLEQVVEEGDDFRLLVMKKFDSEPPHETMKVWWYTYPITADATDYEHLHQVRQASNGYQSRHGRMGRDFHTLEDSYPEIDETFIVEFHNAVSKGHDGECEITITDDDGVGIYKLEITSAPHELPAPDGQQPLVGYAAGDTIEITAHFTGDVTTINPDTGETADYAGIYLQVGENRRLAHVVGHYGADALVFGYQVKPDDLDVDGISVESGGIILEGQNYGRATGFYCNREQRDIGLWPVSADQGNINRFFHGLDDDPAHPVFQTEPDEPTETEVPPVPQPEPETPLWMENSVAIENGAFHIEHGELTEEDGGRDWFSFAGTTGEDYIIEVESRIRFLDDGSTRNVDNHLKDPSILEIIDRDGNQVTDEQDQGGFSPNWARAYFKPPTDDTFYIAVGSGREDRGGYGHYTISVREDDHADDWRANPDLTLRTNQSINARINSDVAPDDTDLNAWAWAETEGGDAVPRWGIESQDDKDVFALEITEARDYWIGLLRGPDAVGIWAIFEEGGNGQHIDRAGPVRSLTRHLELGTYYVAVGTPYRSVGNTGPYTLGIAAIPTPAVTDAG